MGCGFVRAFLQVSQGLCVFDTGSGCHHCPQSRRRMCDPSNLEQGLSVSYLAFPGCVPRAMKLVTSGWLADEVETDARLMV